MIMLAENSLSKNNMKRFLLDFVSLSTPWAAAIGLGGVILSLILMDPHHMPLPDMCLIKRVSGYCPGCGTTRALTSFFKGNINEGMQYNLNVIVTGPLIGFLFLKNLFKIISDG
ncbi:MAG: DUF2752 domain-containing protein [Candidatus Omnitrophota bacterium]